MTNEQAAQWARQQGRQAGDVNRAMGIRARGWLATKAWHESGSQNPNAWWPVVQQIGLEPARQVFEKGLTEGQEGSYLP